MTGCRVRLQALLTSPYRLREKMAQPLTHVQGAVRIDEDHG